MLIEKHRPSGELASLYQVCLVDTNCIDPKNTISVFVSEVLQGCGQVWRNSTRRFVFTGSLDGDVREALSRTPCI